MRISMHDVAKAAKVSQSAVSRVVNGNGYVSEEKKRRILKAIREMGYRPNTLARSLVTSKSSTIGLCLPYLNTPFIASLMEGIEAESEKYGYEIFMSHTKEDPDVEKKAVSRMLDRRVDGLIVVPVIESRLSLEDNAVNVPTIVLLRKPGGVTRNLICAADYRAARRSFSLLLDNGHRDIAVISGPRSISTITERWEGIGDLMRERGVKLDKSLVVETPFDYQKSYEALLGLFKKRNAFTAFYIFHYWASAALLRIFFEKRLRMPEDFSVVAYESFEDWNFMTHLKIATNIFPARRMGGAAVEKLHELISANELFMTENLIIEQEFHPYDSVKKID